MPRSNWKLWQEEFQMKAPTAQQILINFDKSEIALFRQSIHIKFVSISSNEAPLKVLE